MAVFATEEFSIFDEIGNVIPFSVRLPLEVLLLEEPCWEDSGITSSMSSIFFRLRNGLHSVRVVSFIEAEDLQIDINVPFQAFLLKIIKLFHYSDGIITFLPNWKEFFCICTENILLSYHFHLSKSL